MSSFNSPVSSGATNDLREPSELTNDQIFAFTEEIIDPQTTPERRLQISRACHEYAEAVHNSDHFDQGQKLFTESLLLRWTINQARLSIAESDTTMGEMTTPTPTKTKEVMTTPTRTRKAMTTSASQNMEMEETSTYEGIANSTVTTPIDQDVEMGNIEQPTTPPTMPLPPKPNPSQSRSLPTATQALCDTLALALHELQHLHPTQPNIFTSEDIAKVARRMTANSPSHPGSPSDGYFLRSYGYQPPVSPIDTCMVVLKTRGPAAKDGCGSGRSGFGPSAQHGMD